MKYGHIVSKCMQCIAAIVILSSVGLVILNSKKSVSSKADEIEEKNVPVNKVQKQMPAMIHEVKTMEELQDRSLQIASLYKSLYISLDKITCEDDLNGYKIAQDGIDQIERYLAEKGYPVINSDKQYPSYLDNSKSVYTFWQSVLANEDTEQEIINITETGGIFYYFLQYAQGESYYTFIHVEWNKANEPEILLNECSEVQDWELVDNNYFYYKINDSCRSIDAYVGIRLQPMDKKLYELTADYVSPIGYQSNNMFLCDWSDEDYGALSFNDVFEYLYKVRNNKFFSVRDDDRIEEPYLHLNISAELFEETILPYFDVSLEEFRKRSLYDQTTHTYPWQEVCCSNVTYYPDIQPEVVSFTDHKDGTLTLRVNARCDEYKTGRVFTHEVVIRLLEDGGYQYLSNKIIYKSGLKFPPNDPRIQYKG